MQWKRLVPLCRRLRGRNRRRKPASTPSDSLRQKSVPSKAALGHNRMPPSPVTQNLSSPKPRRFLPNEKPRTFSLSRKRASPNSTSWRLWVSRKLHPRDRQTVAVVLPSLLPATARMDPRRRNVGQNRIEIVFVGLPTIVAPTVAINPIQIMLLPTTFQSRPSRSRIPLEIGEVDPRQSRLDRLVPFP